MAHLILLVFSLAAFLVSAPCAALPDAAFHPPHTAAEKALDRVLTTPYDSSSLLKDVRSYLANGSVDDIKHLHYFSKTYLSAWLKDQEKWLEGACVGRQSFDPYLDCQPLPPSCIRDVNARYVYRTLKETAQDSTIEYTWPGALEAYATYRIVLSDEGWRLDGADCGVVLNME